MRVSAMRGRPADTTHYRLQRPLRPLQLAHKTCLPIKPPIIPYLVKTTWITAKLINILEQLGYKAEPISIIETIGYMQLVNTEHLHDRIKTSDYYQSSHISFQSGFNLGCVTGGTAGNIELTHKAIISLKRAPLQRER